MSAREIETPTALDTTPLDAVPVVVAAPVKSSLRSNFAWAFAGNVFYAVCQWGMIVALAKFGNNVMIGQFSLGLALVTPVLMFSNFDLRAVQATDARRQYHFTEYFWLRLRLTLAALAAIALVVRFGRYESQTAAVILAVALAKAVETMSDIHYGLFQLNDRLDQTGRSMILRGTLSVLALGVTLYLFQNVFWACICVAFSWAASLLLFDVPRGRHLVAHTERQNDGERSSFLRQINLLSVAWPLGVVTTLASINLHMPRYFIHARMGERHLGIFSAMAYATVSLTLVGDALGASAIPRLSRLYTEGKLVEYRALLLRLLAVGSAMGLSGLAIVRGFGARLLTIFYNPEYAAYAGVFTLLTAGAAVNFAASMLTSGITSARSFRIQVPLYLLVAGSTAWGCARWIPSLGLAGAALGVICGAAVRFLLAAAVLLHLLLPDAA